MDTFAFGQSSTREVRWTITSRLREIRLCEASRHPCHGTLLLAAFRHLIHGSSAALVVFVSPPCRDSVICALIRH